MRLGQGSVRVTQRPQHSAGGDAANWPRAGIERGCLRRRQSPGRGTVAGAFSTAFARIPDSTRTTRTGTTDPGLRVILGRMAWAWATSRLSPAGPASGRCSERQPKCNQNASSMIIKQHRPEPTLLAYCWQPSHPPGARAGCHFKQHTSNLSGCQPTFGSTIKLLPTLQMGQWQLKRRQRLRRRQSSGRRRMSELLDHAQRRLELLPQRLVLREAPRERRLHLSHTIRSPLLRPRCAGAISQQPARRSGVDALRVVGELAARNSRHRRCRRCRATANADMACDGGRSGADGWCGDQASVCLLGDLGCRGGRSRDEVMGGRSRSGTSLRVELRSQDHLQRVSRTIDSARFTSECGGRAVTLRTWRHVCL